MPVTVKSLLPARPVWPAMRRGLACKCPKCGEGNLFRAFLKVNDTCPACGEALHHHRADDAPPYIAIVIVGHLLIGIMVELETAFQLEPWIYLATMLPVAIVLPIAMLPSIKGAVVALQWANYMHGFDPRYTGEAEFDTHG